jgi:hypothetical protein
MRNLTGRLGAAALIVAAAAISIALHASLVVGLGEQRGRPMDMWVEERADFDECMLGCQLPEPIYLPSAGWADVECRVGQKGYYEQCRWVRESAPGVGDSAITILRSINMAPLDPSQRGRTRTIRIALGVPGVA